MPFYRYAHYYADSLRTLYKAYGIKFIVMAQGRGGKFSVVPLLLNIGSGLGLLAVVCYLNFSVIEYAFQVLKHTRANWNKIRTNIVPVCEIIINIDPVHVFFKAYYYSFM